MCTPKFESHKICKDFSSNNKDHYLRAHNANSNIAFAVGSWHVCGYEMWSVWYWNKKFVVICSLLDNVFRIEKSLRSTFLNSSSLNNHRKFVIGLCVFHNVPTCQTYRKTKETTWTLRTSGFSMKIEYLTIPCKLKVDDFKVWFVVLGFQKNTNQQAWLHYHLILRMRISQTLPN